MRFTTDNGAFGVLLTPGDVSGTHRFGRFQLVIDGELVGDAETCLPGSTRVVHPTGDERAAGSPCGSAQRA